MRVEIADAERRMLARALRTERHVRALKGQLVRSVAASDAALLHLCDLVASRARALGKAGREP